MQQIGQIWGPESDIGPKIRNFGIWPVENLKILKIYRILAFFESSSRGISTIEQAFFQFCKNSKVKHSLFCFKAFSSWRWGRR